MPRNRRPVQKAEGYLIADHSDDLEAMTKVGMTPMVPDGMTQPDTLTQDYVSRHAYAKLVSKLSEAEAHVARLSEWNRRQVHEIETLRGTNSGTVEGNGHWRARVEELQTKLSKCEVQTTQCIAERDRWKENYEAEVRARREEAHFRNQHREGESSSRNDQGQWSRLFQIATFRQDSEAEVIVRLQQECSKLDRAYQSLAHQYDEREAAFQQHLKKVNSNMDELTAHCSSLAKHNSLRRTHLPTEDEVEVVDAFRALNVAVRNWCWNAFELKPEDAELRFVHFPLGQKDGTTFATDDVWFLIACVWEWIMKDVFGVGDRRGKVFDLWLDTDTADALTELEARVANLQKPDIIHEWRSFTAQCLFDKTWVKQTQRMDEVVSTIIAWLLPMLKREDVKSEEIQNLIRELKDEVVKAAVEFAFMLRRRYTSILIGTTRTVEEAISGWTKSEPDVAGRGASTLEIVIVPELRKIDLEAVPGGPAYQILIEKQTYALVSHDVENVES